MNKFQRLVIGIILFTIAGAGCKSDDDKPNPDPPADRSDMYFPAINSNNWDRASLKSLGWDSARVGDLYQFLEDGSTRAFIILKDGKIVLEKYWGKDILNISDFGVETKWYWASAGKTVTSFLVGKAQEMGDLNIDSSTTKYLGKGWTSMNAQQESAIKVRHQLTMTTGMDYKVSNSDCTDPECLLFKAEPGTQWYYHNAPYTLLESVVEQATGTDYNQYTDVQLEQRIGMSGTWIKSNFNNVYWSSARDAARFGLMILNRGKWDGKVIMSDSVYFNAMINTSQTLNPSYGYLWWLNGKNRVIYPGLPTAFNTSISPKAPADLVAALGKNGQFIDVLSSRNIVVVRMGDNPDNSLVPIQFHNEMWDKILAVIGS